MRYIYIILLVIVASSCAGKRLYFGYPPVHSSDTTIIVRDSIVEVIRDSTVYYPVPGDLRIDSIPVPIPCPELSEIDLSKYVLTENVKFARAKSWLSLTAEMELQMHLELEQKEQEIEMHFAGVIRERDHYKYEYEKIVNREVRRERYIPGRYWVLVGLVLGFGLIGWLRR